MMQAAAQSSADPEKNNIAQVWVDALLDMARHYQLPCSPESIRLAAQCADNESQALVQAARQTGLGLRLLAPEHSIFSSEHLPLIMEMQNGQLAIVDAIDAQQQLSVRLLSERGLSSVQPLAAVLEKCTAVAIVRPLSGIRDVRVDQYIAPFEPHWLRKLIIRDWRPYLHVMLASLVANVLGLAGVLFSMQVYDRVIPAQSMPTLYVLFFGVVLATVFALIMRMLRGRVTDILGKRADLRISDRVFGHALRLRLSARPQSTGSFISQLRELEQVRELITSSTLGALVDMPFFLLFAVFFAVIAGPLLWIPCLALLAMLLPPVLMQKRLAIQAGMAMRESSLRNALLVESIQGMEDIKTMQAEVHIQNRWNRYNEATADASMALRHMTQWLTAWSQSVQAGVFAVVVLAGAPLVISGEMTTGALVAASILSSRMLAPMGQLTQVLTRWQHARVAMQGLDSIMQLPADGTADRQPVHCPVLHGDYSMHNAAFQHTVDSPAVLTIQTLNIKAGERVAILGRNGAGKSTLLQALAGYAELASGTLTLDGISLPHIDPADVRRDVGLLSQQSRLFYGSLRDNLTMGAALADDEKILSALTVSGAMTFIRQLPKGLDHLLMEGGVGLSGGQRQALLLSRLLLREPNVLLLDEPTASLDDNAEQHFLQRLDQWLATRTLIVATHRMAVLQLVQRIIVLDNGRIVLDAPREQALARLGRIKK